MKKKIIGIFVCMLMLPCFTVIVSANQPPRTPNPPAGEANVLVGTDYTYNAITTDPDNDNVAYMFDWGYGTYSNWTAYVPSGTPVSQSYRWTLDNGGKMYGMKIKVKAKDINGAESDWSEPLDLIIYNPMFVYIAGTTMKGVQGSISNSADFPLTNIKWTIYTQGGFLGRLNKNFTGTIPRLEPKSWVIIQSGPLFGFCSIRFRYLAQCDGNISSAFYCRPGFLRFRYVLLPPH
jgi:hypothetical protein